MKKGFLLIDKKNKMKATSTSHTEGKSHMDDGNDNGKSHTDDDKSHTDVGNDGKSHKEDDKSHTDVGNDGKSHKDDGNDDGPCITIPAGQRFSSIEALIRAMG